MSKTKKNNILAVESKNGKIYVFSRCTSAIFRGKCNIIGMMTSMNAIISFVTNIEQKCLNGQFQTYACFYNAVSCFPILTLYSKSCQKNNISYHKINSTIVDGSLLSYYNIYCYFILFVFFCTIGISVRI